MKTREIMEYTAGIRPALAEAAASSCRKAVPDISAAMAQITDDPALIASAAGTHEPVRESPLRRLLPAGGIAAGLAVACGAAWMIASVHSGNLRPGGDSASSVTETERLGLPDSAVWNPDLCEWYDGDHYAWDAKERLYTVLDVPAENQQRRQAAGRQQLLPVYEAEEFTGTVPAELDAAMNAFWTAREAAFDSNPMLAARSDWVMDVCPEEYDAALRCALRYFDVCEQLSVQENKHSLLAMMIVSDVMRVSVMSGTANPGEFLAKMQQSYADAGALVRRKAESGNLDSVSDLQAHFGFLIADALRDLGRLDLLQIPEDASCKDPEQLADFAAFFDAPRVLPEELEQAFAAYEEAYQTEYDAFYASGSIVEPKDPAAEELAEAAEVAARYFTYCVQAANPNPRGVIGTVRQKTAERVMSAVLLHSYDRMSAALAYNAVFSEFQDAAERNEITAEFAAEWQREFGAMVAPPLRAFGRLDLMQIPADAPCKDPERLAIYASLFAPFGRTLPQRERVQTHVRSTEREAVQTETTAAAQTAVRTVTETAVSTAPDPQTEPAKSAADTAPQETVTVPQQTVTEPAVQTAETAQTTAEAAPAYRDVTAYFQIAAEPYTVLLGADTRQSSWDICRTEQISLFAMMDLGSALITPANDSAVYQSELYGYYIRAFCLNTETHSDSQPQLPGSENCEVLNLLFDLPGSGYRIGTHALTVDSSGILHGELAVWDPGSEDGSTVTYVLPVVYETGSLPEIRGTDLVWTRFSDPGGTEGSEAHRAFLDYVHHPADADPNRPEFPAIRVYQ